MTGPSAFERAAAEYDAWFDAHPVLFESEVQALLLAFPEAYGPTGRWAEIGVGTGRFASRLGIPVGVEPAEAMAAFARSRGIRVFPGTAECLPLGNESADAVFFITTLCFVADIGRALAEARRILVPGGLLVVGFLPRERPLGRRVTEDPPDAFLREARLLSTPELLGHLRHAGFEVLRTVQTLRNFPMPETVEAPIDGFGRGSFVVIRCARPRLIENLSMQS